MLHFETSHNPTPDTLPKKEVMTVPEAVLEAQSTYETATHTLSQQLYLLRRESVLLDHQADGESSDNDARLEAIDQEIEALETTATEAKEAYEEAIFQSLSQEFEAPLTKTVH